MKYRTMIDSPFGPLKVFSDGLSITGLYLPGPEPEIHSLFSHQASHEIDVFTTAQVQLDEYFAGVRQVFDLALNPQGTDFQQMVWHALCTIPYGTTISYKGLASMVGRPSSIRAVGQANGRNPISILIPCHRVIGVDGSLTGYGGGIERKAALLNFEKEVITNGPRKLADKPAYDLLPQPRS
jgi:methylated-DNA-[protein]-cysteine S-methyltransferase